MVMGDNKIDNNKKYASNTGDFDCHADAAVRCGAHRPMEHIPGFPRSHWMPSLGKCLHCITVLATIVAKFAVKHQNTNKTQLFACNYSTNQSLVIVYDKFVPQNEPSTHFIDVTSFF